MFFFTRLILVRLMEILARTERHALHFNKADSSANAYQDGKASFVKSTPTTVLRNLVSLARLVLTWSMISVALVRLASQENVATKR